MPDPTPSTDAPSAGDILQTIADRAEIPVACTVALRSLRELTEAMVPVPLLPDTVVVALRHHTAALVNLTQRALASRSVKAQGHRARLAFELSAAGEKFRRELTTEAGEELDLAARALLADMGCAS